MHVDSNFVPLKMFSHFRLPLFLFLTMLLFSFCGKNNMDSTDTYAVKYYDRSRPPGLSPTSPSLQPNLVIMGDGYREADFPAFTTAAKALVDHLFSVYPFNGASFSQYFNIYFLYLNSQERGIGHGSSKNTFLRCYFADSKNLVFDDTNIFGGRKAPNPFDLASQYVYNLPLSNTVVVVLVNDTQIGYSTGFRDQPPYDQWISLISVPNDPNEFKRLILREVGGKAFAHLAQEDLLYSDLEKTRLSQMALFYGFYSNIDFEREFASTGVKWKHFMSYPSIYGNIGVYPIGNEIHRPDNDNVMMVNGKLEYDAPSQEAIIKRVYQIHQWDYNNAAFNYYFVAPYLP